MRVLGIDPGLTRCGVGVVEGSIGRAAVAGRRRRRTHRRRPADRAAALPDRGRPRGLARRAPGPTRSPSSGCSASTTSSTVMGTAQASGIAMLVAARRGLPVALHTPSEVKAAVTGSGRADKAQVGAMVTRLLRLDRGAQAGRRRRLAGPGHLPHLARARPPAASRPRWRRTAHRAGVRT